MVHDWESCLNDLDQSTPGVLLYGGLVSKGLRNMVVEDPITSMAMQGIQYTFWSFIASLMI